MNALKSFGLMYSINITFKIVGLFVFFYMAAKLSGEHLGLFAFVPASIVFLMSLFGFGVNTQVEKLAPKLFKVDELKARGLLTSALIVNFLSFIIVCVFCYFVLVVLAVDVVSGLDFEDNYFYLVLALGSGALMNVMVLHSIIIGKVVRVTVFKSIVDLMTKVSALCFYLIYPGEISIFLGYSIIQMSGAMFLLKDNVGYYVSQGIELHELIRESMLFWFESILNSVRGQGDQLVVAAFLGAKLLGVYYVVRVISIQMTVFFNPIINIWIRRVSGDSSERRRVRNVSFIDFWNDFAPVIVLVSGFVGSSSVFILQYLADGEYYEYWMVSYLLCFSVCLQSLYTICSQFLLVNGGKHHRLLIGVSQVVVGFALLYLLVPIAGVWGVALTWLITYMLSIINVMLLIVKLKYLVPGKRTLPVVIIAVSFSFIAAQALTLGFIGCFIYILIFIFSVVLLARLQSDREVQKRSLLLKGISLDIYMNISRR